MKGVFNKLSLFNAAEASLITFVIMSFMGAAALWITEADRMVVAKVPVLHEVTITPKADMEKLYGEATSQVHTFTQEIKYKGETFIDMWFTSISALCVTGLTSTDFSQFTLAGQIITLILIQMGGLGIIVFTSIFAFAVVRGFSERTNFKTLLASLLDTSHHYCPVNFLEEVSL